MALSNYQIKPIQPADYPAIEYLTREAFWNVYQPGATEHYIVHQFQGRPALIAELNLGLWVNDQIIGHIMYVKSQINLDDGQVLPIVTFGPLSIAPKYQHQGYGGILLLDSMKRARELGFSVIAITGNLDFYGRFGFVVGSQLGIHYAAEPRDQVVPYFLIHELIPGTLNGRTGTYKDPDGYSVDPKAVAEFDRQFPPKQQLKLPGQLQ
ncbi:MAG: N-acetyltransferase [Lactobacillus sp.]|jgi:predicted N-acetyltransferase YhbS|nr:N-acetyltransferase [Lactobacillus sp.]